MNVAVTMHGLLMVSPVSLVGGAEGFLAEAESPSGRLAMEHIDIHVSTVGPDGSNSWVMVAFTPGTQQSLPQMF